MVSSLFKGRLLMKFSTWKGQRKVLLPVTLFHVYEAEFWIDTSDLLPHEYRVWQLSEFKRITFRQMLSFKTSPLLCYFDLVKFAEITF